LKGKVRIWGTPNYLKLDFWVKNGWKRFLGQKYNFDQFCEKSSKIRITHQMEAPKLELALALTSGICMHSYSALAPSISAEKVKISGKVDFSHLFQWENRP